ncbi:MULTISPECIES: hypothetical protein [Chryseobacterium]|uniref:Class IIb bacteriocin, lactobin A/cerein 7B family n=3 Tax=Chryseobacterium TaxID=59732 RepID=A0A3M7TDR9_9FLAO|nr:MULTISPECIES: hypothetical protein [Chryseobacterium]RMZ59368.1 hypothetical protein D1632_06920 [Chryseobacterium nematophagum]RNA61742.1 hypothetical protein D1631_07260 [Chryseobacterium nematophagum]CAA7196030.1 hypothetical protein CHRY9293_02170 [Chryseobacterium potabilaquae]CAA7393272.1 hypothetical protein CHRY9393_03488 [Chryseobacterium fistulae]
MQLKNVKVEALTSQEIKSVEGGFGFVPVLGAIGVGLLGGAASATASWGATKFWNWNNGRRRN